jgi:hypothetical protein
MTRTRLMPALLLTLALQPALSQRSATAIRPDDALIYALAINHLFPRGGPLEVVDSTSRGFPVQAPIVDEIGGIKIDTSTIANFQRRSAVMFSLRGIIDSIAAHLTIPVTFIATSGIHFNMQAVGPGGIIWVTPIGYSSDGNEAVLNVDHRCGGRCGGGTLVVLRRVGGVWAVVGKRGTWVS